MLSKIASVSLFIVVLFFPLAVKAQDIPTFDQLKAQIDAIPNSVASLKDACRLQKADYETLRTAISMNDRQQIVSSAAAFVSQSQKVQNLRNALGDLIIMSDYLSKHPERAVETGWTNKQVAAIPDMRKKALDIFDRVKKVNQYGVDRFDADGLLFQANAVFERQ